MLTTPLNLSQRDGLIMTEQNGIRVLDARWDGRSTLTVEEAGVDILGLSRAGAYAAARTKDAGGRSDVEAGMAKLLAARVAWTNADASLQIHGGNGYALETEISRILCDARILSVFEGAAEIQAHIIARGLLERGTAER